MKVDKLAEVGAKRPQAEQPSSLSKQAPPETNKAKFEPWWPKQAAVVPNTGKGNRLWRSLAGALTKRRLTSKERTGKSAFVHAYMQKFTKEFENMWVNQGKVNSTGEKTSETWEEYLELDEQAWICDLTAGEDAE